MKKLKEFNNNRMSESKYDEFELTGTTQSNAQ